MYHVLVSKKNVQQPGHFQYTILYEGYQFFCPRTQTGCTSNYMHFHLFKYVVNKSFSVSHFTSQFFAETQIIFSIIFALAPLGRYSTFQYADQDAYQDAYPEDFNADALFHVSVSIKRICLCLPYYQQCLHNIVIIHMKMQCLFIHNVVNSIFSSP